LWRWYKYDIVSFWCEFCYLRRFPCSFSVLREKLQGPPNIVTSEAEDARRAKNRNRGDKQASEQKIAAQSTVTGTSSATTQSRGRRNKKPKVDPFEQVGLFDDDPAAVKPALRMTASLDSISSLPLPSLSLPSLSDLSSFHDMLTDKGRSVFTLRDTLSKVRTARLHEQNLAVELSSQVKGRDLLYLSLIDALEKEARALEKDDGLATKTEVAVGSGKARQPVASSSTRPRNTSEPAVEVLLEDTVDDSEYERVEAGLPGDAEGSDSGEEGSGSGEEE